MSFRGISLAAAVALACSSGAIGEGVFIGYLSPGPNWPEGVTTAAQIDGIMDHVANMQALDAQGVVFAGGPFVSQDSALVIFRADSLEEATSLLLDDPFVKKGYFALDVSEWSPSIGSLEIQGAAPPGFGEVAPDRRTMVQEYIVGASVGAVWNAFTTTEGLQSFIAPLADSDFRVGGTFRTNYNAEGKLGDETTITHHVLSFEPGRMYSSRVTAPAGFPWPDLIEQTWSVVRMDPVGPNMTRLRLAGCNYGSGPGWDEMAAYFDQGNGWVVEQLRIALDARDIAAEGERVMALLGALVGGEWAHESTTPDGGVFRSRNVIRRAADGVGLTSIGWLGDADGMYEHGSTLVHRTPEGLVRFVNINQAGAVAEGVITLEGDNTAVWDWRARGLDGAEEAYVVKQIFTGDDAYTMHMHAPDDPARLLVNIDFTRVDASPKAAADLPRQEVVYTSRASGDSEIYLLRPSGETTNLTNHSGGDNWPVFSPDGSRIAFQRWRDEKIDIWVMNADGSDQTAVVEHEDHDYLPAFSPDGQWLTFTSWRTEANDAERAPHLYVTRTDGSEQRRLYAESLGGSSGASWAPDGDAIVFSVTSADDRTDLFLASVRWRADGPHLGAIIQLTDDENAEGAPVFSHDGSRIAFYSTTERGSDLVVMNRDGSERRTVLSGGQAWYPRWSTDNAWLIYTAGSESADEGNLSIRAVCLDGSDRLVTIVDTPARDAEGSWRPRS
jgi:TolB protein